MEINLFLEPVHENFPGAAIRSGQARIGDTITIHRATIFPDLDETKIALIGVCDDRASINNEGCANGVDSIREAFYQLFNYWPNLKIVDLGNIKQGYHVDDTYFALAQVMRFLLEKNIVPMVLSGGQDLTYAMYQSYGAMKQLVNITAIDSLFDLGSENDKLNSRSYLSQIIIHQPNYLFNFTNIGYQTYYVDYKAVDLMKNLLFDTYRLGVIRSDITEVEPLLRNTDLLSFDIGAVRSSDAPGNANTSPNGFTGEEACRMMRYAGLSAKLSSVGFFEYNPLFDRDGTTANLIAQMMWYFVEGFMHRKDDYPTSESSDFTRYTVQIEGNDDIIFLYNKYTERWWIDLSMAQKGNSKYEKHHFIPCSQKDYDMALREEIPDRWWQFYQKLM
ncbi:MAG: formimidoylglutamase [Lentimicrobiaceae bacterium]|jgi:arginase family enzyme|nr:formimidoylglutamase [Lentimicrobiaceae bacterium]